MSLIPEQIPQQNFELITLAIGAILKDEIANQYSLNNNPILENIPVYVERHMKVGDEEKFVVNVMFASSDYQNEDATQSSGINQYFIDVHATGKYSDIERGDSVALSNLKLILGLIRAILRHSKYYRLLFDDPVIVTRSRVKGINISEPRRNEDSSFLMQGRLVLEVNALEFEGVSVPVELNELLTKIKINETDGGLQYLIEQN